MTTKHDLKRLIRERMDKTGERYAAARRNVLGTPEAAPPTPKPITGWLLQGATPHAYELALDPAGGPRGEPCARLRSREKSSPEWSMLTQFFIAEAYRGARLRLSARIRTLRVAEGCGLWMRLYANEREVLYSEAITRDEKWAPREVVLDVDEEITLVSFGFSVYGAGTAWFADVAVERVGPDVPVTATRDIPSHPVNLGFVE